MKIKLVLAALFLSLSVLLLQSNSFSTAEVRNDVAMSVVDEGHALIAITDWDSRIFSVVNNTESNVEINSMWVMGGEMVGVEGWPTYIGAGGVSYFTLIGEATELSGQEIWISASWESGQADIKSWIPPFIEEIECMAQPGADVEDENEDTNLQEIAGEEVNECMQLPDEDEEVDENGNEEAGEEEMDGTLELDDEVEIKEGEEAELSGEPATGESVNSDRAEVDPQDETILIEEKNLTGVDETEGADDQEG